MISFHFIKFKNKNLNIGVNYKAQHTNKAMRHSCLLDTCKIHV